MIEAQGSYIGRPHDTTNLLHGIQVRAEATVHRENLFVYNGSNWQAIEAVGESLPQLDVVSSFTFVVKAVDTVDRCTLMVASQDKEILWIFDLVCK